MDTSLLGLYKQCHFWGLRSPCSPNKRVAEGSCCGVLLAGEWESTNGAETREVTFSVMSEDPLLQEDSELHHGD